jgi:hypothetical protein
VLLEKWKNIVATYHIVKAIFMKTQGQNLSYAKFTSNKENA